jgi:beta-galactosidase
MIRLALAACLLAPFCAAAPDSPREVVSLDAGWRFHRHDPAPAGPDLSREALRPWLLPQTNAFSNYSPAPHVRPTGTEPGADLAAIQPGYDDSDWRTLDLPHDWGIEGPFDQDLPGDTAKLPWHGVGWYRKTFPLPAADAGRRLTLEIDGAMSHSAVWLNGRFVGGWPYGYTSFRLDLTPYARPGQDNTLAIRLDNPKESSRWYPGGGLYRHMRLVKTAPVHVAPWSVFVTTPLVSADSATVDVQFEVENHEKAAAKLGVSVALHALTADGQPESATVAQGETQRFDVRPGLPRHTSFSLRVPTPRLWDLSSPHRYVAVVTVERDGRVLDRFSQPFGIRSLSVDPDRGLILNGRPVRILGVCQHHDLGALGAAVNVTALERQLRILKEMGANSIRTSHNPPTPELLDLCDRMGLLVQVEAFDCWALPKKDNDYASDFPWWHEADLRAMIRRDRNHPSVVMWSTGNEVVEQRDTVGWRLSTRLAGIVREEDRTRPVTAGFNGAWSGYIGFETGVDVFGYNYKPEEYPIFRKRHPSRALIASETASTVSSRGEYFFPVSNNKADGRSDFQVSSYDLYAPGWAMAPDREFTAQDDNPSVLGEYVWTGFDYLGEPTPYNSDATNILNYSDPAERERAAQELAALGKIRVPSRSSYFGIIDLAGFPKDRYFLYQARWRPDLPMAHLLPHWTWPGREGQVTPVHLYTSGDEAELFLNGVSLGRKKRAPRDHRLRWDDVVYQPGELRAVAYKKGVQWAETVQRTAGPATKLALAAERPNLRADGRDLAFLTLRVEDAAGLIAPRAKLPVRFEVTGPADVIATDNGDATSFESFQSPERRTFNGLALAIVRARPGATGEITVTARAEGLAPAEVKLRAD